MDCISHSMGLDQRLKGHRSQETIVTANTNNDKPKFNKWLRQSKSVEFRIVIDVNVCAIHFVVP